jgi:hypothetical protein
MNTETTTREPEETTPLPLPCYIGEPSTATCSCPECGDVAEAEIRFVCTGYVGPVLTLDSARGCWESARGCWEPAIYVCPAGHYTMESEL